MTGQSIVEVGRRASAGGNDRRTVEHEMENSIGLFRQTTLALYRIRQVRGLLSSASLPAFVMQPKDQKWSVGSTTIPQMY